MTDDELEALLDQLEADLREDVQAALTLTAQDFAFAVDRSTELTAATFSVSRIGAMWRRRVGSIMTRLRAIAARGARVTAEDLDEPVPPLTQQDDVLTPYLEATRGLLDQVGDRLSAAAVQSLAEGVAAGETTAQLKRRMTTLFDDDGTQLGPTRAQRIAATEATRAFNAGTLAAAQALTGPDRPLVKQWVTRNDERVRIAHRDANAQLQLIDDPFDVGGTPMQYPGDPTAPADLTINCRCIMRTAVASERTDVDEDDLSAAADVHTGAMIALMPSKADAERLALIGGEVADQLHMTLYYLGDAADWPEESRDSVRYAMQRAAGWLAPVSARAFGVAQWNPQGDSPAWVWNIGDDRETDGPDLAGAHHEVTWQLEDQDHVDRMPPQYTPWSPHVCGAYGEADVQSMTDRVGPVTFDRLRVAFAGEYTDYPLLPDPDQGQVVALDETIYPDDMAVEKAEYDPHPVVTWSTPDETALAFENQQTGDGRVFAPGALYWDGPGPWPLQYADEMMGGHEGAQLAGCIDGIGRDGDRIPGHGKLYVSQQAGAEAAMLLAQKAPLGVSVDLDDVDLEMVDATPGASETYRTRLLTASLFMHPDGGFSLTGETESELAAGATGFMSESRKVTFTAGPDGTVPGTLFELEAAAGDPDLADGVVVESQRSGDYLVRITRGRIRGATLVTIPAYANARIVLDDPSFFASAGERLTAGAAASDYDRVVRQVRKSVNPMSAARLAKLLKVPIVAVRRHLARAARKGDLVRLTRGQYTGPSKTAATVVASVEQVDIEAETLVASATGAVDLPVADRDETWDGDAAATRVFEWADGDTDKIGRAFAYRDDSADPATKAAYKLGYADIDDGQLVIIPAGVAAALGALHGARGGVNIPEDERDAVSAKLEAVAAHVAEETGEDDMDDMQASAWKAMADIPPMPAAWFREPTLEELPPGGPGVNYANGRIFGWVAQAGEPHAGYAKKITIDSLGRIDTSHFLRQRFSLDDGSTVKAGAYTMNVGHHRDSAECETSACQFDDTRTVAGIVTVGMNERGMWFSGAAAPWLSEWDRVVFKGTQPSYHMKKGPSGNWQLRAVLGVPVPGHSSPLLASAVIERSQMALTAAATLAEIDEVVTAEEVRQAAEQTASATVAVVAPEIDYDRLADALVASMGRAEQRKAAEDAELAELLALADKLDVDSTGTEGD